MMLLMFHECRNSIATKLVINPTKPFICSAIMGGILLSLSHTGLYLSIPIGIAIYSASMFLLKGMRKDDIVFLKERLL
jgi:hypothetical protein